ncbi:zinc-dependent metalloprotease [Taibaiella soli]|uniref:PKD domain-containing protein n=1 Tax=Taibaiella soli TaxID=1649169 RepID=A0A2W2BDZ8_9BACT|nr:zinc-dependent metalloprotease [Taibaiella soli]PZF74489.1 hypothetical protein DN068_02615 [Taibaiella soli]
MVKKAILLMSAAALIGSTANAQLPCGSDEAYQRYKAAHPEVAMYEKQLEAEIAQNMKHMNLQKFARTTNVDENTIYDIPLVFHIVHDYGTEYLPDSTIFTLVEDINQAYSKTNTAQLAQVIPTFAGKIPGTTKDYIGKINIRFHLATKDPSGNPTRGITRRRSYVSYNAGDNAKFDQWAPNSYMNVWFIRTMSAANGQAAAYAYQPPAAAGNPYIDGVMSLASYAQVDNTIAHELGHCLNLAHPWGNTNQPGVACGDDDVDDTPPTKGHNPPSNGNGCTPANLYDSTCATGYAKTYSFEQFLNLYGEAWAVAPPKINDSTYDSTATFYVNYPDTTNAQNIMDYTYCSKMFTFGQGQRMRAALLSATAQRNHLFNDTNLLATGALQPLPDMAPVADFSLARNTGSATGDKLASDKAFGCANNYTFTFINRSWNDTIVGLNWEFTNGANPSSTSTSTVTTKFAQPGWATVTLTATGNGTSGTGTISRQAVYVADTTGMDPEGYVEEFSGSLDKWPMFNYFNNNFKWSTSTIGTFDNSAICYNNYDTRSKSYVFSSELTGTPQGDYDDLFTPAFNLTDARYGANCNLNFMSASASRTTVAADMRDSLEIWYSTDCANTWRLLTSLTRGTLHTNGTIEGFFAPGWPGDWALQSINIPPAARSAKTFFRFRYKPGADATYGIGSGNNFYMDRLQITAMPTGVNPTEIEKEGVTLAPNPTTGSSNLYIKGGNGTAQIRVTDIAGKVVFTAQQQLSGSVTTVEIPATAISVKGMYLVQVVSNNRTNTEKLVVY